jgi:putative transposase
MRFGKRTPRTSSGENNNDWRLVTCALQFDACLSGITNCRLKTAITTVLFRHASFTTFFRIKDPLLLLAHLLSTIANLVGPGGAKTVVAQSLLMKQQLLIVNRSRRRAPGLSAFDRFQLGFWSLFLGRRHIRRAAVIIQPSTLFKFHDILKKRKYRLLYSSARRTKPGPKGPSPELVRVIVEMKQHNPRFGCRRIAMQITDTFGIDINKDLVRRVLDKHYRPIPNGGGPSWLTFSWT